MVGANYTGGRRNAAKARSKDTATRLQRGHFSKQRLGILTGALGSRRPDHESLSRPPVTDNPNLTAHLRSGFLISPSGYSTCTPVATVHDISLGHAKRDLARKHLQPQLSQSTQHNSHFHRNEDLPFLSSSQPGLHRLRPPAATSVQSPSSLALTGKQEPDSTPSLQTLLPAGTSVGQPSATSSPPHTEPAPRPPSPEKQPPIRRSKILDLVDASDREHTFSSFLDLPHCMCTTPLESRRAWRSLYNTSHTVHLTYPLDHT